MLNATLRNAIVCRCIAAALALYVLAVACISEAHAHEFWLEMVNYQPAVGATVPIIQRAGQDFAGSSYPYLSADTRRYSVAGPAGEQAIQAIEGDDPAGEVTFTKPGLHIIAYHGADNEVVFKSMTTFEESLRIEYLQRYAALHRAAGKPLTGIREQYARCAKALVAVGDGNGQDRAVGMPLELIAERNPYLLAADDNLPVRLIYQGKALPGVTVKLFSHANPSKPAAFTTDAQGRVSIPISQRGEYMVHAVHMREPPPGATAHWSSLWASLTFFRP